MLTVSRALKKSESSAPPLPEVKGMEDLYHLGLTLRRGEVIMIAGVPGSQKSGLAIWLVNEWNLPTLYFAADMTLYEISVRLACSRMGRTTEEISSALKEGGALADDILDTLNEIPVTVSTGLISWEKIDAELGAYIELWDSYPEIIVIDNLMDVEGGESDYAAQMGIMQSLVELARATGSTVIVLHHATEKSDMARKYSTEPPTRADIKNGMAEKPQCILGVAVDVHTMDFKVAILKQRMGPADRTAKIKATLTMLPTLTRFKRKEHNRVTRVETPLIAPKED